MWDADVYNAFIDHLHEAVYVVDRNLHIVHWNAAAERITGYFRQEVSGKPCQDDILMHCTPQGEEMCDRACPLKRVMEHGAPRSEVLYLRHKNGFRVPVRTQSLAVRDNAGNIVGAVSIFEDAQANVLASSEEPEACLDAGTHLAARRYGEFRLTQRLARLDRFGVPLGWLRIELEEAKELERRFGHAAVEAAASLVARALRSSPEGIDFLARWDRASFRAAIAGTGSETLLESARRLSAALNASQLEWWGDLVSLVTSVGGTAARRGDSVETLEQRAAVAVENARQSGGAAVFS
jgi:PAS domain S-box-containing protein/diguanylate cyclase (GGDEF)-like protein